MNSLKITRNKKGQEEMLGFAIIVVIVGVILLIFLGFSMNKPQKEAVESYEAESFIQAILQHTTSCRDTSNLEFLSVQKLLFDCYEQNRCLDGKDCCIVLNSTLKDLTKESWPIGSGSHIAGYELNVLAENSTLVSFQEGNKTRNYKGASQDFSKIGTSIDMIFKAYY